MKNVDGRPSSVVNRWGVEPRLLGVLAVLIVILALLGLAKMLVNAQHPVPAEIELAAQSQLPGPEATETSQSLMVYVSGAVTDPGVQQMQPGDRVVDALDAAGGPTAEASLETINLARLLVDGEQIHVQSSAADPGANSQVGATPETPAPSCIDLNNSSVTDLQTLVGIGPALAERIIQHRETNGPFTGKESLLEVSGIGPKIFAGLEADLCG